MWPIALAFLGFFIGGALLGEWLGPTLAGLALGLVVEVRRRLGALELEVRRLRVDYAGPQGAPRPSVTQGPAARSSSPAETTAVVPQAAPEAPLAPRRARWRPAPPIETDILDHLDEPPDDDGARQPARAKAHGLTSAPATPDVFDLWWTQARDWLLGGNLMVRAGVVVLFFGVAFLLKLAAENVWMPVEVRLAGVVACGIVLLGLGWQLRGPRPFYALALQGGGVGILYLAVFAALRLYGLVPPGVAFAMLAVLAASSAALAVLQNAPVLAVLGAAGGFLAPVLTSTGQGSHVALFSYYLVLNLGILGIAWFRSWRALNLTGFAFTFVSVALWGGRLYRPDLFSTTEPFLIAFSVLYVALAVLYALRQQQGRRGLVDPALVLGVPLVGFALQAALVQGMEYGLAWSALAAAAFYLAVAVLGLARWDAQMRLLAESFLAIAAVFATLAVPLALGARWTTGLWALEGAAMAWIGARQGRLAPRLFGYALQLGAALAQLRAAWEAPPGLPTLNGIFLGAIIVAVAGLFIARNIQSRPGTSIWEDRLSRPFLAWGVLWWYGAWILEIVDRIGWEPELVTALALCCVGSSLLADRLRTGLPWDDLRLPALSLLPLLYLLLVPAAWLLERPFEGWAPAAWVSGLSGHLYLLRRAESGDRLAAEPPAILHPAGVWLILILLSWELAWWLNRLAQGADTWSYVAWALVPTAGILALGHLGGRLPWPISAHPRLYRDVAPIPVALFLWAWILVSCLWSPGGAEPLPYLPLLNPLDIAIGLALLALTGWLYLRGEPAGHNAPGRRAWRYPFAPGALGLTLFLWINSAWLRTAHHWLGLPFSPEVLLRSQTVQSGLSVLWALAGLGCMLLGSRLGQRQPWLAGAGLMVAVVLKLFLVDLSGTGTLARIVSFLSVGFLLLAVGYLSPLPPRAHDGSPP
jgi:uncharacterized membrane protein